jgi:hypothetical protein
MYLEKTFCNQRTKIYVSSAVDLWISVHFVCLFFKETPPKGNPRYAVMIQWKISTILVSLMDARGKSAETYSHGTIVWRCKISRRDVSKIYHFTSGDEKCQSFVW